MARIDYYNIESTLATLLRADTSLEGIKIIVEDANNLEAVPTIFIYMDRRDATESQAISAGTRARYRMTMVLVVYNYSLDSMASAVQARDDLLGKLELVVMSNRTINGLVTNMSLEGGELPSDNIQNGYVAMGELILTMEASAIATS